MIQDYRHFPRIIGRKYRRRRFTRFMAIVSAIIFLAALLFISAVKGNEQAYKSKDMRGACKHSANMWLSEVD